MNRIAALILLFFTYSAVGQILHTGRVVTILVPQQFVEFNDATGGMHRIMLPPLPNKPVSIAKPTVNADHAPPSPPAPADVKAYRLTRTALVLPTCTNCPHCFGTAWDIQTTSTNLISYWDHLIAGYRYDWQTRLIANGPPLPWVTVTSGLWTDTSTDGYFGLELPVERIGKGQEQRAVGHPPGIIPLASTVFINPLRVSHKGSPYVPNRLVK